VATAFLTAFYMFRMWFMTFSGSPRSEYHAHESPKIMTVPLMVLAGLALVSGFSLFIGSGFRAFIEGSLGSIPLSAEHESLGAIASEVLTSPFTFLVLGLVIVGILLAYRIYFVPGFDRSRFAAGIPGKFQKALENRWYISKFYDDFAVTVVYGFSKLADVFDRRVIDGAVNGFAYLGARTGNVIRKAQSGNVQRYASLVVVAIVILLLFILLVGGA